MRALVFALLTSFTSLVACAPTEGGPSTTATGATSEAGGRQCFNVRSVNGFNALDRETVNVTVGVNEVWQLSLFGTCQDVDWANRLAIRSRSGGSFVCDARDIEVIHRTPPTGPQRCQVQSMRRLTAEEAAASRGRTPAGPTSPAPPATP